MKDNYQDKKYWYGFDLDGTLTMAIEPFDPSQIGEPIFPILDIAKDLVRRGERVKIFTARVAVTGDTSEAGTANEAFSNNQHAIISAWCRRMFGRDLEVTCVKDFRCVRIYDDRATAVERNTGRLATFPGIQMDIRTLPPNLSDIQRTTLPRDS